jgi:hypothetical protein
LLMAGIWAAMIWFSDGMDFKVELARSAKKIGIKTKQNFYLSFKLCVLFD